MYDVAFTVDVYYKSLSGRAFLFLSISIDVNFARLIIVRCYLNQPFRLNFNALPHVLFTRKDKLEVYDPFGQLLRQSGTRVNGHRLRILHGSITSVSL